MLTLNHWILEVSNNNNNSYKKVPVLVAMQLPSIQVRHQSVDLPCTARQHRILVGTLVNRRVDSQLQHTSTLHSVNQELLSFLLVIFISEFNWNLWLFSGNEMAAIQAADAAGRSCWRWLLLAASIFTSWFLNYSWQDWNCRPNGWQKNHHAHYVLPTKRIAKSSEWIETLFRVLGPSNPTTIE